MDLVTLITACALGVDPKLMHALVWHQSGGEPWAISAQGETNPRVFRNMQEAIQDARERSANHVLRVGLAGISAPPSKVSASILSPCRNVAMAASQITRYVLRCNTHPRLKHDAMFCAIAVYRGSWAQPDTRFATDVTATAVKGDAPNFDMPRGTRTEAFDTADDLPSSPEPTVVDITAAFADQARGWSSALFPPKSSAPSDEPKPGSFAYPIQTERAPVTLSSAPNSHPKEPDRELFVRRSAKERSQ